jgi:hypothetical protein
MKFTDWIKGQEGPGALVMPKPEELTTAGGGKRQLCRGMWVWWDGKPGIITEVRYQELMVGNNPLKVPTVVDVMLTDELGINKVAIQAHVAEVRQAKLEEIPGPRRPAAEIGQRMGY